MRKYFTATHPRRLKKTADITESDIRSIPLDIDYCIIDVTVATDIPLQHYFLGFWGALNRIFLNIVSINQRYFPCFAISLFYDICQTDFYYSNALIYLND